MTNLTLGQRIASKRKLLGMSQETLAEQVFVSRQAVSKWESDAAVPEIDKLISLGKIFGVSVGWLLGVESEVNTTPAFSDEQMQMIEQLFVRYSPKKKNLWLKIVALVCTIAVVGLAAVYYNGRIQSFSKSYEIASDQISFLTADNEKLQEQLSSMNELLSQQIEDGKLLTEFYRIQANTDENGENILLTIYAKPKVFLEGNQAYLYIENPNIGYCSTVECNWSNPNQVYVARFSVPVADDYKFKFLLVNEYGYEEENLLIRDPALADLGMYTKFYLDPSNSQYHKMQRKEPSFHSVTADNHLGMYSFNVPIYSPHIFAKSAAAYKDIRISMLCNGEIIWEQSYLDEFYAAAGGMHLNASVTPVMPKIEFRLPKLSAGDELELVLTAETVNGGEKTQTYFTLLDYIKVVE